MWPSGKVIGALMECGAAPGGSAGRFEDGKWRLVR